MTGHILISIAFAILTGACARGSDTFRPQIEVEIVNSSQCDIEDSRVHFGGNECRWGWVSKTARKSYLRYPHPVTPDVELHWNEDGKHRVEKLDLRKIYPPGKSGRLTFTVHDGRVEVTFREKTPKP